MASRRLVHPDAIASAERLLADATAAAVHAQRHTLHSAMTRSGLVAAALPAPVWDQRSWTAAVARHVTPAATKAAAMITSAARVAVPAAATWGAALSAQALSARIVDKAVTLGDRLGTIMDNAASRSLSALDDALDTATGWAGEAIGRLATVMANECSTIITSHAANQGIGGIQSIWNAVDDDVTRTDHADADGQPVGPGEPFQVGDDQLMFPGDDSLGAGPEQTENCRCYLSVDGLDARSEDDGDAQSEDDADEVG